MINVMKERKIGIIVAIMATVLDFTVLIIIGNLIGFDNGGMTFWMVSSAALAVISYIIAGGLSVAWKAFVNAFKLGAMFPVFPINLATGWMCASFVIVAIWLFPIIAVLIACYGDSKTNR